MKRTLQFNPIVLQKVYGLSDGNKEVGQVQAANVHEAMTIGRIEIGERVRCAYLIPGRQEPIFQMPVSEDWRTPNSAKGNRR